jgi:hypothetical protein
MGARIAGLDQSISMALCKKRPRAPRANNASQAAASSGHREFPKVSRPITLALPLSEISLASLSAMKSGSSDSHLSSSPIFRNAQS